MKVTYTNAEKIAYYEGKLAACKKHETNKKEFYALKLEIIRKQISIAEQFGYDANGVNRLQEQLAKLVEREDKLKQNG